jgi:hypothetical protein
MVQACQVSRVADPFALGHAVQFCMTAKTLGQARGDLMTNEYYKERGRLHPGW